MTSGNVATCTYSAAATSSALPATTITAPRLGGYFEQRARIRARFSCSESGSVSSITACSGTVANGLISTGSAGTNSFTVTATDNSGNNVIETVRYATWAYATILALGNGKVTFASNTDSGPVSCWGGPAGQLGDRRLPAQRRRLRRQVRIRG